MPKNEIDDERPPFAILKRELDKLLRKHAPDAASRSELRQLILDIQRELHNGPWLRAATHGPGRQKWLNTLRAAERALRSTAPFFSMRRGPEWAAVRSLLGAEVARSFTEEAFRLAGIAVPDLSPRDVEMLRARAREPDRDVETERQRRRLALSNKSPIVFSALLTRCHAIVAAQLDVERGNRGGRPSDPHRTYLLYRLATKFETVFGVPPSGSETGAYVVLAEDMLKLLGLEAYGVEYAAKRVLSKLRRGVASRAKPKK